MATVPDLPGKTGNKEEEVYAASLPNEFPVFRGWPHVRFSRMNQNSGPSLPRLGHE